MRCIFFTFLFYSTAFSKNNTIRLSWDRFTAQLEAGSEFKKLTVEKVPEEKLHCLGKNTPCLSGRIVLQRNAGRYLLKSILPSTFIVLMTFIGFCLPTSFKTSLLITALLNGLLSFLSLLSMLCNYGTSPVSLLFLPTSFK